MFSIKGFINILCVIAALALSQNAMSKENVKKNKIPDGGVTTPKLADGAVTIVKLAPEIVDSLEEIDNLNRRINRLKQLVIQQHQAMQMLLGCVHPASNSLELIFDGCDVHIRNGSGMSGSANMLGNLIIGYNEDLGGNSRIGSHNLIIGPEHSYNGTNGIVAGTPMAMIELEGGKATLSADAIGINSEDNIFVESNRGDITIESQAGKVEVEASQSIEIKVDGSSIKLTPATLTTKSATTSVEASSLLELESIVTRIKGTASLDLRGGITQINGGGRPVARLGDTITGVAGPHSVVGIITGPGSLSVLVK